MREIKFGTDGWRGFMRRLYVRKCPTRSGAIASYVLKHENAAKGVVVGYDTRFLSRQFADACQRSSGRRGHPGETGERLCSYSCCLAAC